MKNKKKTDLDGQSMTVFSFLEKIAESDLENMIDYLNETNVNSFQKQRLFKAGLFLLMGIPIFFLKPMISLVFLGLAVAFYFYEYLRVKSKFNAARFQKELVFLEFSKEIYIYLLENKTTIYSAFQKMKEREKDGFLKDALQDLLIDLHERPDDVKTFIDFANRTSGSDRSKLFMITLFEYHQNSKDDSIIYQLGKMTSEQLFLVVDDIIEYKHGKFLNFPMKITMPVVAVVLVFFISLLVDSLKAIQFGGG
ncbi:hypothetical protein MH138_04340 [Bacillus safensis]|uniref:hypothetical protein n=1 Tax=Bacillus safensis TaxID=561879 RepID=UPI00227F9C87|nr:hypothetical protein [Bacillus safensis]MCY7585272.1 hypothetical protein [Bacillus safensis]MCY7586769.1 hypothetical protein [Bacillus safensis]MCY7610559.1 hypothetical protein [Bacillus safensis]